MAKEQIPEFKNQSRIRGGVSTPSFQDDTSSIALQPSMLGEISTNLAMRASTALAEKQGYEMGQSPQGDLGIPLTSADVAFQNAYNNQAQASLGLQGHKMIQDAQLTLAETNQLTPDLIESYHNKMKSGFQSILDNAPTKIKPALQNQFESSLIQSMGSITTKMIGQQKKQAQDSNNLYNQTEVKNLYEMGFAGNIDAGIETLKNLNERTDENIANNTSGEVEGQGIKEGAKIALYSGLMSKNALNAKNDQKLEPFLDDMAKDKNKPKELSEQDWQKVQRNTLGYIQNNLNLESKENVLTISKLNRQLNQFGSVDPNDLAKAEKELPPAQFNNLMTSIIKTKNREFKKNQAVFNLTENWASRKEFSRSSAETINKTYESILKRETEANPHKSIWEIETDTAAVAAGAVPEFTKELSSKMNSFVPGEIEDATRAYNMLLKNNPLAVSSIDKNSIGMMHAYQGRIANNKDPVTAAEEAHEVIYGKDKDQHDANVLNYRNFYRQKHLNVANKKLAFAQSLSQMPYWSKLSNPTAFSSLITKSFETNYHLLNGDLEQAKKMTTDSIKQNWGSTYVNGQHEYSYLPIERTLGLPQNAAPVIQNDMAKQVGLQFDYLKSQYDKDSSQLYYYSLLPKTDATKNEPLKVNRVYRDGHKEEFELALEPSALVSKSNDPANPIVGDYDVKMRSGTQSVTLSGLGPLARNIVYRPNLNSIHNDYLKFFKLTEKDMDSKHQEYINKELKRKQAQAEGDDIFNMFQLF